MFRVGNTEEHVGLLRIVFGLGSNSFANPANAVNSRYGSKSR